MVKDYSITDKIYASINISVENIISIYNVKSDLSDKDISITVDKMIDTRLYKDDICVYQFNNYGLYITGKNNPLSYAMLEYNDENRVDKRNSRFFGDLQPYMHHNNTPKDGINLYSFALEPEKLQPTGTSNLSKIENVILTIWPNNKCDLDDLNNRLFIYAFSYNIFRVMSGLSGLCYN